MIFWPDMNPEDVEKELLRSRRSEIYRLRSMARELLTKAARLEQVQRSQERVVARRPPEKEERR